MLSLFHHSKLQFEIQPTFRSPFNKRVLLKQYNLLRMIVDLKVSEIAIHIIWSKYSKGLSRYTLVSPIQFTIRHTIVPCMIERVLDQTW